MHEKNEEVDNGKNATVTNCQACYTTRVDVIRFCHHLIVKGKCHHEGDGDIEQGRAEEIDGVKSGGCREDDR